MQYGKIWSSREIIVLYSHFLKKEEILRHSTVWKSQCGKTKNLLSPKIHSVNSIYSNFFWIKVGFTNIAKKWYQCTVCTSLQLLCSVFSRKSTRNLWNSHFYKSLFIVFFFSTLFWRKKSWRKICEITEITTVHCDFGIVQHTVEFTKFLYHGFLKIFRETMYQIL